MGKDLHKMVQMLSTVGYTERKGRMKEALTMCQRACEPDSDTEIGSTFAGSTLRSNNYGEL